MCPKNALGEDLKSLRKPLHGGNGREERVDKDLGELVHVLIPIDTACVYLFRPQHTKTIVYIASISLDSQKGNGFRAVKISLIPKKPFNLSPTMDGIGGTDHMAMLEAQSPRYRGQNIPGIASTSRAKQYNRGKRWRWAYHQRTKTGYRARFSQGPC
ncbi:hypothetical protein CPC08DRAFT_769199 [Agrocybe pediades]|nr:hypothetical protein CPC08DRAFT_769199 [Agrocybe pediades]